MSLIADIRMIYDNYDFATQILVASVRRPIHVLEAAKLGADAMTPAGGHPAPLQPPLTKRHRGLPHGLGNDRAKD